MVSKDVIFDEKTFYYRTTGSNNLRDIPLIIPLKENTVQEREWEPVIAEFFFDIPDFHLQESNNESGREEIVQEETNARNLRMY